MAATNSKKRLKQVHPAVDKTGRDPEEILVEIRRLRAKFRTKPVSIEWIDKAIRIGRP